MSVITAATEAVQPIPSRYLPVTGRYIRFGLFDASERPLPTEHVSGPSYLVDVQPGQSFELVVRNLSRHPLALAAALRARCASPDPLRVLVSEPGPMNRIIVAPHVQGRYARTVGGPAACPYSPRQQELACLEVYPVISGQPYADLIPAERFTLLCRPGA